MMLGGRLLGGRGLCFPRAIGRGAFLLAICESKDQKNIPPAIRKSKGCRAVQSEEGAGDSVLGGEVYNSYAVPIQLLVCDSPSRPPVSSPELDAVVRR